MVSVFFKWILKVQATTQKKLSSKFLSIVILILALPACALSVVINFFHTDERIYDLSLKIIYFVSALGSLLLMKLAIPKILISLKSFVGFGFVLDFFLCFSIGIVFFLIFNDIVVFFFLFTFLLLVFWVFLSIFSNTQVAITGNAILTALFAILVLVINAIIIWYPPNYTFDFSKEAMASLSSAGYTSQQFNQIIANFVALPFIITNSVATILCILKGYWLEKHPEYHEISWKDSLTEGTPKGKTNAGHPSGKRKKKHRR